MANHRGIDRSASFANIQTVIVRSAQADDLDAIARLAVLHTVGANPATFLDRLRQDLESEERCLLVAAEGQPSLAMDVCGGFSLTGTHPRTLLRPATTCSASSSIPTIASKVWAANLRRLAWRGLGTAAHLRSGISPTPTTSRPSAFITASGSKKSRETSLSPDVSFAGGVGILARSDLNAPDSRLSSAAAVS